MDQGIAALLASVIAAVAALLATLSTLRSARMISLLAAKQNIVGQYLKDLSHYLYQVVALCVEAKKAKSDEKFLDKLNGAKSAAEALGQLRIRHRHSLPFIFDPIWYLKGTPIYFEHYRNDLENPRLNLIQKRATELRKAIDAVLEKYFFHGKIPGYFDRRRLRRMGMKLEKSFLDGKPLKN